jgi:hypothetical protein
MFQAGYELDSNRGYTDAIRARLPSAWTRLLNAMPGSCRSPARSVTLYPLATLTARVDWLTLMSYSARWPGPKPSRCFADRNYARAARTPLDPRYPPPGPRLPHQPPPAHATVRHPHQPPSATHTGHRPPPTPATVRRPHQPPSGIHTGRAPPPSTPHARPCWPPAARIRAPAPATLRPRRSLPPRTPRARPSTHQQSPPGALLAAAQHLPRRAARAAPADGPPGRRQPGCPRCSANHRRPARPALPPSRPAPGWRPRRPNHRQTLTSHATGTPDRPNCAGSGVPTACYVADNRSILSTGST